MLPREKIAELDAAGYPLKMWRDQGTRSPNYIIPSGDELLAECVKLLRDGEWMERLIYVANNTTIGRCYVKRLYSTSGMAFQSYCPDIKFESRAGLTNNTDLADAWLWLNERKKVKE